MRAFGWLCVIVAVLVFFGGIMAGRANHQAYVSLCSQGRTWACLKDGTEAFYTGAIAAAIIGAFGVLVLAIRRPRDRSGDDGDERVPCPYCAEDIKPAAILCPHCRTDLRAAGRLLGPRP